MTLHDTALTVAITPLALFVGAQIALLAGLLFDTPALNQARHDRACDGDADCSGGGDLHSDRSDNL